MERTVSVGLDRELRPFHAESGEQLLLLITGGQEYQLVQVGARQAKRLAFFHREEISFGQLRAALAAVALGTDFFEHDQIRRPFQFVGKPCSFLLR